MLVSIWFVLVCVNVRLSHQITSLIQEEIRNSAQSAREKLINIPNLDKGQQRKTIADIFNTMLLMTAPSSVPYGAMEARSDYIYVCANNGQLQGMEHLCMRMENMKVTENPDGSVQFDIPFILCSPLFVKYDQYVQHIIMNFLRDKKGEMEIGFSDGNVDVHMFAEPPSTMVDKLNSGQCVLRVVSVKVTLSTPFSRVSIGGRLVKRLTKRLVQTMLLEYLSANKEKIEEHVRYSFYHGLLNAGDWLCWEGDSRASRTSEEIRPLYVPKSDEYKTFCGDFNRS